VFEKRCLQAPYEGRGCQPLRSSPCEGFTAFAGSAYSTLGLYLQAIVEGLEPLYVSYLFVFSLINYVNDRLEK